MDPLSIVMILAVVVLIFFMFRNGKKRQRAQQELRESMRPGVEIMLGSGIYGTILNVDEENNRATIESGTATFDVHMQAISQVVPTPVEAADDEPVLAPDDDPEFGERIISAAEEEPTGLSEPTEGIANDQSDELDVPSNEENGTEPGDTDSDESR